MPLPMVSDIDDRRTCATCTQIGSYGPCMAARRGEIVASRTYEPDRNIPRRCEGYRPDKSDPDQRPGFKRWPNLNALPQQKEKKTK